MIIVSVELNFTSVPCFQLSLHLKSVQTQKPLFLCHRRLWCNIILQAPWMERVALTAFICKSLRGSVLLTYKSRRHQRFALWFVAGKHQICTNGKKKKRKTLLTAPPSHLRFDQEKTAASLQVSCKRYSRICRKKSHTGTNIHNQSGNKVCFG